MLELNLGCGIAGMRKLVSVDVVLTDTPYSKQTHERLGKEQRTDGGKKRDGLDFDHFTPQQVRACAKLWARLARRWVIIFCDDHSFGIWREEVERAGLEFIRQGAWVKIAPMPQMSGDRPAVGLENLVIAHRPGEKRWNGGGRPAVYFEAAQETGVERAHPNQKPLRLYQKILADFTEEGETVLDPFSGSANLAIACRNLGRSFRGWEISPERHGRAMERLSEMPPERAGQLILFNQGA